MAGPLRAFVPLVTGLLGMRRRTFQLANTVSAVVWVLVILAPGYFAAKGLAELEARPVATRDVAVVPPRVIETLAEIAARAEAMAARVEEQVSR